MYESPHSLQFLENRVSVYYAGLDDLQPPYALDHTVTPKDHVRNLKALTLFVEHVAVPPTFIVAGIPSMMAAEHVKRQLQPLFDERVIVSAVHSTMAHPVDFIDYKLHRGAAREREFFASREAAIRSFFTTLPLLHRDIVTMSLGYRSLLLKHLHNASRRQLRSKVFDRLMKEFEATEKRFGPVASREDFLLVLQNSMAGTRSRQFRVAFDLMNAAYYREGALTYGGNIVDVHVTKYIDSPALAREAGRLLVAYDPDVLASVLHEIGLDTGELDILTPELILDIRSTKAFRAFVRAYFAFADVVDRQLDLSSFRGLTRLERLRTGVADRVRDKFRDESEALKNALRMEDWTTAAALGALGFVLTPLAGAAAGLAPLLSRYVNSSPGQLRLRMFRPKRFVFSLYMHVLRRKYWLSTRSDGAWLPPRLE